MSPSKRFEGARTPGQTRRVAPGLLALVAAICALSLSGPVSAQLGAEAIRKIRLNPLPSSSAAASAGAPVETAPAAPLDLKERVRNALEGARSGNPTNTRVNGASLARAAAPLSARLGVDVELFARPRVGTPMQIRGERLAARVEAGNDPDLATARSFLHANRALMKLEDPEREVSVVNRQEDALGYRHIKFEQRYRGLRVWPAEMIVHLDRQGNVSHFDGAYVPTPDNPPDPIVGSAAAVRFARAAVPGGARLNAATPELIVYAPGDRLSRLAWKIWLTRPRASRWLVVVDAVNGARLAVIDDIETEKATGSGRDLAGTTRPLNIWKEGNTYYLMDTSKMMYDPTSTPPKFADTRGGISILDDANIPPDADGGFSGGFYFNTSTNPNSWSVPDAVSASFFLSQTYDYYLERHARNSLDGKGGSIMAIVRVDKDYDNAYWDGTAIYFGDGKPYAGALDIVGHELTHGVTDSAANLVYQNQSGALNEAMSDIFGQAVEARFEGSIDWLHGDSFTEADRNMKNPGAIQISGRGYPSKMSEFIAENDAFLDNFSNKDNGGVHINSSIINHAFYTLAEGLPGAVGIRDAEKIFYRALTVHLLQNSQFLDGRLACVQSAAELFGAGSNQAKKTAEAFDAVEIYDTTAPPPPPPPVPAVAAADSTIFTYYSNQSGNFFLGRREAALGDPVQGTSLGTSPMQPSRPSVTGNGTLAFFVNSAKDACFIATNAGLGAVPSCLGFPGQIYSVSMSPNGNRYGFVLLDAQGFPDNRIFLVDLAANTTATATLIAPSADGASGAVLYAESMSFTANGRYLIYDALTVIRFADGSQLGLWAIYAIDFSSGQTVALLPPTLGFDLGNPALGHLSDTRITFEARDQSTGQTSVWAGDLQTGDLVLVASNTASPSGPVYSGDDSAIIFMYGSQVPTGVSLARQGLAADHLTPSGAATVWLSDAGFGVIYRRGSFSGPQASCVSSDTTLCLNDGRFQVTATWTTPQGQNGPGHAVKLTSDTGYFWFFSSANVEVVFKALNACGLGQRFWVFGGGLTNVAAVITVADTVTGVTRTYSSKQGTAFQPIQDTNAFATCFGPSVSQPPPAGDVSGQSAAAAAAVDDLLSGLPATPAANGTLSTQSPAAPAACSPTATSLCLNGGRFRLEATYRTAQGQTGNGQAVGFTPDTGYFWFFSPNNVEVIVKAVNACTFAPPRYWVFAGGLTNVEVTMRVTDTATGAVKQYVNPLNKAFAPIQDTNAFATCP